VSGAAEVRAGLQALLPWMHRYARSLTRNVTAAEDLVQDACLRAVEKADQFQPGTRLKSWVGTIMFSIFANSRKKSLRWPVAQLVDTADGGDVEFSEIGSASAVSLMAADRTDIRVIVRDVDRVLGRMPATQVEAILLLGVEGLSYEEAAARQGVAMGTFKSRASRARAHLNEECRA
jgi:RNA polymerase sigma-70 factor, ECF subfamily